jgi:CubicO group peptidase (beta-lactamase class C family)/D-alanyl-D-alanine dipeptidase
MVCRLLVPEDAMPFVRSLLVALMGVSSLAAQPAQPYADAIKALDRFIAAEVAAKQVLALSIALVDDQTIVWAHGFGDADPENHVSATAQTVYRVGSISKLFTDIAAMQLVERGVLDVDAPVTRYLPNFRPQTPYGEAITLRHLMAHRSGLVREPPTGHYFDPTSPGLQTLVESLNRTQLVSEPGARTKYSNAGISVVGYVLEKTQNQPFAAYVKRAVFDPMGLKSTSFENAADGKAAKGQMWTYDGRTADAPTFPLAIAPAGNCYSTAEDLGQFLSVLFAGGRGILKPETLKQMLTPQFAPPGTKNGFGMGFVLSEFKGCRCFGHAGAVYGFATQLSGLPEEKLGVIVIAAKDCVNGLTSRIGETALAQMLAARHGQPLPTIETTWSIDLETARKLSGHYVHGDRYIDLEDRSGRLFYCRDRGEMQLELRVSGDSFVVDDALAYGTKVLARDQEIAIGGVTYERKQSPKPAAIPERWVGLVGEYGWDHDILYILEKDGKLHALIEWFYDYPLQEIQPNVFKFPNWGLYEGEQVMFHRDSSGKADQAEAAGVIFKRRHIDGEDGKTFRVQPVRPLDELRQAALAAQPPHEAGSFRKSELVDLVALEPTIKLDIRYASTNNFLSTPFYTSARAFMQKPAAEAVVRVHHKLREQGLGLLIHDGYRPWSVTKMFWDATTEKQHTFVADPSKGSRHNRGCAVDLTLFDLQTGKPIQMVGGYDEMSDRSYPFYPGGTSLERYYRDLLRHAMEAEGFTVYEAEWWHFDYKDWRQYGIQNLKFEEL